MKETLPPFFYTPESTGLIKQVKHLCQFSADIVVIEGDRGSGKTAIRVHN